MKKSFFDFFPPPKYLAMPALGFDISDQSIKYAELYRKNGVLGVARFGVKVIPKGIIESGEIKKKEELVEFLSDFQKELNTKRIVLSLPEEKAFLSRIQLPIMKKSEIRGALELQLDEYVPLSARDAIFDFELMREDKSKKAGHMDINVIAFPKTLIEDYREVFKKAGFLAMAFEMEARAAARAVVPKEEQGAYLIMDFGKTRTTFTIVSENKIQFTSTINVAGEGLDHALSRNLNLTDAKAKKMKKEIGLVQSKENEEVFDALLPVVAVIKDEMRKNIFYWDSHLEKHNLSPENKISKVLLYGGDSNLTGFPEYLAYELRVPVELANPWVNIASFEEHIPEMELKKALVYTTALGLSLRSAVFNE